MTYMQTARNPAARKFKYGTSQLQISTLMVNTIIYMPYTDGRYFYLFCVMMFLPRQNIRQGVGPRAGHSGRSAAEQDSQAVSRMGQERARGDPGVGLLNEGTIGVE